MPYTFQIKDNKLNSQATIDMFKAAYGPDNVAEFKKIVDECAATTDPDRCKAAFKIMDCYSKTLQKANEKQASSSNVTNTDTINQSIEHTLIQDHHLNKI